MAKQRAAQWPEPLAAERIYRSDQVPVTEPVVLCGPGRVTGKVLRFPVEDDTLRITGSGPERIWTMTGHRG